MRRPWPTGGCCAPPKKVGSIRFNEMIFDSSVIHGNGIQGRIYKKGLTKKSKEY